MKCLNIESRIILPLLVKFPSVGWGTLDYISLLYMKDNHDIVGYADRHCGILPIFAICPPGQPSNIVCIQRQKSCGNNTFGVFLTSTSLKATLKFIITSECTSSCFYSLKLLVKEQEFVIVFQIGCTI